MKKIQVVCGALWALATAVLVVLAPAPAVAGKLATATVYAGGVDFLPHVAHDGATVRVSGQGLTFERSFAAGEHLTIGVFDPDGQLLPDGVYSWRLELTPDRATARELRRAARRNGGVAPEPWAALTGSFAIRDGLVADPDLRESRPERRGDRGLSAALPADLGVAARGDRTADDTDAAALAGRAPQTQAPAELAAPADRTIAERTDAATLAAGPEPARSAATDERVTVERSWPTDGKNGREQ